ncbi:hypothetical protein [Pseudomonas sp. PLMAX]|jgi:hypothetical protein|uniref:hypothetical protein n=1 Tax=Pseudomonas sp. PLMAX TaxID=2201998 RepID=UPI0038BAA7FC
MRTLGDLIDFAESLMPSMGGRVRKLKLKIPIFSPGRIGGSPSLDVHDLSLGFDHDQGQLFVCTEQLLSPLSREEIAAIQKSVSMGQSYHAYQQYKAMMKDRSDLVDLLASTRGSVMSSYRAAVASGDEGKADELASVLAKIDAEVGGRPGKRKAVN